MDIVFTSRRGLQSWPASFLGALALAAPLLAGADDLSVEPAAAEPAAKVYRGGGTRSVGGGGAMPPESARIRIPGSITERSRQMILDFATDEVRERITAVEVEIRQLDEVERLTAEQLMRRDQLIRSRFKMMRGIVKSHPTLHSTIKRVAGGHRYRSGVMLARKMMENPQTYQQVISRADPETAEVISRNNESLRRITTMIKKESAHNFRSCDAVRMDALYKKMSRVLDKQVGALERTGFVKASYQE